MLFSRYSASLSGQNCIRLDKWIVDILLEIMSSNWLFSRHFASLSGQNCIIFCLISYNNENNKISVLLYISFRTKSTTWWIYIVMSI